MIPCFDGFALSILDFFIMEQGYFDQKKNYHAN